MHLRVIRMDREFSLDFDRATVEETPAVQTPNVFVWDGSVRAQLRDG